MPWLRKNRFDDAAADFFEKSDQNFTGNMGVFASSSSTAPCPFCNPDEVKERILWQDDRIQVILDKYPSARRHLLVIPRQHIAGMPSKLYYLLA
jgi:hypothetical protein